MANIAIVLAAAGLALLTGCGGVVSVHPLALPHDKDVVFEPELIGTWEDVEPGHDGVRNRYTVSRHDAGYDVLVGQPGRECADAKNHLSMHLLRNRGHYVADLYLPSDDARLPVHLFMSLRLESERAWVAEMQSEWLMDQVAANRHLRHEIISNGTSESSASERRILLTASSAELRQYLLPFLVDGRARENESELRRLR